MEGRHGWVRVLLFGVFGAYSIEMTAFWAVEGQRVEMLLGPHSVETAGLVALVCLKWRCGAFAGSG